MKKIVGIILAAAAVLFGAAPSGAFGPCPLFFPAAGSYARLDGGQTLVVQNGFSLRFFDGGEKTGEVLLSSEAVGRAGKCSFSNKFIFLPGEEAAISVGNGGFSLSGCCLFLRDGNPVREFASPGADAKNALPVERAFFVGEELLVLKSRGHEFIYNLRTDEIKSTREGAFLCYATAKSLIRPATSSAVALLSQ